MASKTNEGRASVATVPDTKEPEDAIRCNDDCKASVLDMDAAMAQAWTYLEITKRWRCPSCRRALDAINHANQNQGL